jgi:hypothetical protein
MARFTWLIASSAALGLLLPVAAQAEYRSGDYRYGERKSVCNDVRGDRQAAGAVIGGLLGAAIGNSAAADNTKSEGTALGAVLGAAIGAGVSGDSAECDDPYARHAGVYGQREPNDPYWRQTGAQRYPQRDIYPNRDLRGGRNDDWRYRSDTRGYGHDQHGQAPYRVYREDEFAGRQCETVWRTIRLPDGREIREPVRACREAIYGDWEIDERR